MKYRIITIVAAVFLIAVSGLASADILPKPVPENQLFTMDSIIEAVGPVSEKTTVVWNIGDAGLTALAAPRLNAANGNVASGSIAYVTYSDSIVTNGGQLSEVKSFSMSTGSKTEGLYNIETSKVLTYTSQNGSHLMGEESYVLDVAGNWRAGLDGIVCVFSRATNNIIPAFCNKVTASSKLTQVTTAQIETIGALTAVSDDDSTPAALKYEVAVAPDSNSASGYADGIVSTTFTVSVMEGRSDGGWWNGAAADSTIQYTQPVGANGVPVNCGPVGTSFNDCKAFIENLYGPNFAITITAWNPDNGAATPNAEAYWTGTFTSAPINCGAAATAPACQAAAGQLPIAPFAAPFTGAPAWAPATFVAGWPAGDPFYPFANELASRLTYIDSATVSGGISTFNKVFDYKSGVACANC